MSVFRNLLMQIGEEPTPPTPSVLPSEYQQVEWIGNAGNSYIDSGIITDNMTSFSFEAKIKTNTLNTSWNTVFMDAWHTGLALNYYGYLVFNNYPKQFDNTAIKPIQNNTIYEFIGNLDYLSINGTEYPTTAKSGYDRLNHTIHIFKQNRSSNYGYLNIYYLKFYDNNVLVADFVPCYRKSDGVIGLYDLVRETFFTNVGVGTFTKGNDV